MSVNKLYDHSENTPDLVASATDLQGQRLLCHCKESEECHADSLVAAFLAAFPGACVTGKSQDPLSQAVALAAAEARTERNEHSEPDVDAPHSGAGWIGHGGPLAVVRVVACKTAPAHVLQADGSHKNEGALSAQTDYRLRTLHGLLPKSRHPQDWWTLSPRRQQTQTRFPLPQLMVYDIRS